MVGVYWCCMVMLTFCIIILMYVYGKERRKEKIGKEGRKREKETLHCQCAVACLHIRLVCVCEGWQTSCVSFFPKVTFTYSNESHVVFGSHTPKVSINQVVWIRNVNNWMYKVWDMKELNVGSFQWFICFVLYFYRNVCRFKVRPFKLSPFKCAFSHWVFNKVMQANSVFSSGAHTIIINCRKM